MGIITTTICWIAGTLAVAVLLLVGLFHCWAKNMIYYCGDDDDYIIPDDEDYTLNSLKELRDINNIGVKKEQKVVDKDKA